ncbi:ogr/Delta-like zinc finger family protein [Novosphingobium sp. SL115]|uniref:ogr/Delta-like zinc finger family protein n=1 Tax=Novosphingobium sp. SL115 TaxID=2995150 RepID=UPI00227550A2|nr:ogr/Delta-like zinc finger family protein [Novosphingobium sp. SL115]MCY1672140.1 ogr/Delta-like zinc finger family protein [Novosphingobium sp. SL115]
MSGEGTLPARPLLYAPMMMKTRSGGTRARDAAFVICPKCDEGCVIRRSARVSETVKHLDAICSNPGCGHTFAAQVVFVHSYSPGLIDRPDLHLPICPPQYAPSITARRADADEDDGQISMFSG